MGESSRAKQVVELAASAAALTAVSSAVLYYYGWLRMHGYYDYFGIPLDAIGISNSQFILRSVAALFQPILIGLLFFLGYRGFTATQTFSESTIRRARKLATWSGAVLFVGSLIFQALGLLWNEQEPLASLIPSSIALIGFALAKPGCEAFFNRRSANLKPWLAWLLAALVGFWWLGSYATYRGNEEARLTAHKHGGLSTVAILSSKPLNLSGIGVSEKKLGQQPDAYYQTEGLQMLIAGSDAWFLLPAKWERGKDQVVSLKKSLDVTIKFTANS